MRSFAIWLSILLLAITVGWFWLLSHDLRFTRVDQVPDVKTASEPKTETKKAK